MLNLGFTEKSGEFFVVAGLRVDEENIVNRCIKKDTLYTNYFFTTLVLCVLVII